MVTSINQSKVEDPLYEKQPHSGEELGCGPAPDW